MFFLKSIIFSALVVAAKASVEVEVLWANKEAKETNCPLETITSFADIGIACVDEVLAKSSVTLASPMTSNLEAISTEYNLVRNLRGEAPIEAEERDLNQQCLACDPNSGYYNPYMCVWYQSIGWCSRRLIASKTSIKVGDESLMLRAQILKSCGAGSIVPQISRKFKMDKMCQATLEGMATDVTVLEAA